MLAALILFVFSTGKVEAGSTSVSIGSQGEGFDPEYVEIYAGDSVIWTNEDTLTHTVTDSESSFDSFDISPDNSWELSFSPSPSIEIVGNFAINNEIEFKVIEARNNFDYYCKYHPMMEGTIQILIDENDPLNYEWNIDNNIYSGNNVTISFEEFGDKDIILNYYNSTIDKNIEKSIYIGYSELVITQTDITLEIDGVVGNASQVHRRDTVVILVDVQNTGTADALDVRVEIFYYPKQAPTDNEALSDDDWGGFEFDEGEGKWIYSLYDKVTNIESYGQKNIMSDDWLIRSGEWYVEVRVDYDEDNVNGEILEPNENNNDARYPELFRIKSDLAIDSMRIDSKYAGENADTPNVDDIVTFTVTVANRGAVDVDGARLYITADDSEDNEVLKDRTNKDYVDFDVDAGETTDVRFRWKAIEEEWTTFRAEINPVCDDYGIFECESAGDGLSPDTGHMFDELGRYADNEYPRSGVFEQSGSEVKFEILPDFVITQVDIFPMDPKIGKNVDVTITVQNIGNADWQVGTRPLSVEFRDQLGSELSVSVGESINKGDSVAITLTWTVPDTNDEVTALLFSLDVGTDSFEIKQCNSCDSNTPGNGKGNDQYQILVNIYKSDEEQTEPKDNNTNIKDNELYEGDEAGECSDGADNDKDGLFDCDDDTCAGSPDCKTTDIDTPEDLGLPSISLLTSLILVGLLAIFRRKN